MIPCAIYCGILTKKEEHISVYTRRKVNSLANSSPMKNYHPKKDRRMSSNHHGVQGRAVKLPGGVKECLGEYIFLWKKNPF